jgi:hypothetical protein
MCSCNNDREYFYTSLIGLGTEIQFNDLSFLLEMQDGLEKESGIIEKCFMKWKRQLMSCQQIRHKSIDVMSTN